MLYLHVFAMCLLSKLVEGPTVVVETGQVEPVPGFNEEG